MLSRSEEDPAAPVAVRRVEAVFERDSALLDITVAGHIISTTGEHPFYAKGRGWVSGANLSAGDQLSSADGAWTAIESISPHPRTAPVYNVRVADFHTYFVGSPTWPFSVWA